MKRLSTLAFVGLSLLAFQYVSAPAFADDVVYQPKVGDSGFYGRLQFTTYQQPHLLISEPVSVYPVSEDRKPIYLLVPDGYAAHWSEHCSEFQACGERVLFVQSAWYKNVYAPQHRNLRLTVSENDAAGSY